MSSWLGFQSFAKKVGENVSSGLQSAKEGLKEGFNEAAEEASTTFKVAQARVKKDGLLKQFDLDNLRSNFNEQKSPLATKGFEPAPHPKLAVDASRVGLFYVSDRLIAAEYPQPRHGKYRVKDVGAYLEKHHAGHYMIWNLAEQDYDRSAFGGQIIDFKFPGHPAPPLGLLLKICTSIESWLKSDSKNVAVVHCLTGKGRTMTVTACSMAWSGTESVDGGAFEMLDLACRRRRSSVEQMTIPTQRRYVHLFNNMLEGVKPKVAPVQLRRILITSVPNLAAPGAPKSDQGCRPYIQLFKNGKMLYSSTWALEKKRKTTSQIGGDVSSESEAQERESEDGEESKQQKQPESTPVPEFVPASEGTVSFEVNCVVQGDMLLRCRHLNAETGEPTSMFRAGFHTGYVPNGVLRLSASQLDGASADARYTPDFFVDLIFAPVASKANPVAAADRGVEHVQLEGEEESSFDQLIADHSDFWDEVSFRKTRREGLLRMAAEKAEEHPHAMLFSIDDDDDEDEPDKKNVGKKKNKENDNDLRAQLEALSFTGPTPASTSAAPSVGVSGEGADAILSGAVDAGDNDASVNYLDELEELERELGLDSFSSDLREVDTAVPVFAESAGAEHDAKSRGGSTGSAADAKGEPMKRLDVVGVSGDTESNGSLAGSVMNVSKPEATDVADSLTSFSGDDELDELDDYLNGL